MQQSNSWLTSIPDSRNQWDVSNMLTLFGYVSLCCNFFLCSLSFSSHFPFLCTPLFILSSFFFLSLSTFLPPLLNFLHLSFTQSSQTTTRQLQIQSFSRAMHSSFKLTNVGLMHTCAHQYMHYILSSGALSAVVI